ncbi:MAG: site-specific integrase, partial [bacterium]
MGGWKKEYGEDEIEIFEKGLLSKRGDYWHFRLWLEKEKKYVRRSLKTRKRHIAVELAKEMYLEIYANVKQGKSYYSITCEQAVERWMKMRLKDYEVGQISYGRYATMKSHLKTWKEFIGAKKRLKDLTRKDCE